MRVLFVMAYPGYLRYYGSTVRLLAERSHEVYLAFDNMQKQSEGLKALEGASGTIHVWGRWPTRDDVWKPLAGRVRGLMDYLRYLHPRFRDARYLRTRMAKKLPPTFSFLSRVGMLPPTVLQFIIGSLGLCERAIPSSRRVEGFVRSINPDVLLVTPIVNPASLQVDLIKVAHTLGIRTGIGIASWDHLTTKGLIRVHPDRLIVWNETQKREAVELHRMSPSRVVVTGAQPFDDWFEQDIEVPYDGFCKTVGLNPLRRFVLFVGSTASISAPDAEKTFVWKWIRAVRARPAMQDLGILIRPHPYNSEHWRLLDLSEFTNVSIWPRSGANPVDRSDRADYFASLYHASAVVGINTSAMVEASILGRPVLTVLTPEFEDTQSGTLHFHYLLAENGGCAQVAYSLEEHARQLEESLRGREGNPGSAHFVQAFVRPQGRGTPCTPLLVDAIEELGRLPRPRPQSTPPILWPLKGFLWVFARLIRIRDPRYAGQIRVKAAEYAGRALRVRWQQVTGGKGPTGPSDVNGTLENGAEDARRSRT